MNVDWTCPKGDEHDVSLPLLPGLLGCSKCKLVFFNLPEGVTTDSPPAPSSPQPPEPPDSRIDRLLRGFGVPD